MKAFVIACLIAGAFAEPEADADAYYYGNYGYGALGYAASPLVNSYSYAARPVVSSYAARPVVSSYSAAVVPAVSSYTTSPYVSTYGAYGLRTLGKRSADAEPEAEADAYYYNNYGYSGLTSYGAYAAPLVSSYAARPLVSSYAARPYVSTYGAYAASPYSAYNYLW